MEKIDIKHLCNVILGKILKIISQNSTQTIYKVLLDFF